MELPLPSSTSFNPYDLYSCMSPYAEEYEPPSTRHFANNDEDRDNYDFFLRVDRGSGDIDG